VEVYEEYARKRQKRFKWLRADLFVSSLEKDLATDANALHEVIKSAGKWNPDQDAKLTKLVNLWIIRLRSRIRQRLHENAEVVGTDEAFFEDDRNDEAVLDLYNEKSGILDGEADTEVDLAS
jgi:hypothetical protein